MLDIAGKKTSDESATQNLEFDIPGVPNTWRDSYVEFSNEGLALLGELIRDIRLQTSNEPRLDPAAAIQAYLGYYEIYVVPVDDEKLPGGDGRWDQRDGKTILILHRKGLKQEEAKITIAHELMHFLQAQDGAIIEVYARALESGMPTDLVARIIDTNADRAALRYIMPARDFLFEARKVLRNPHLSLTEGIYILARRYGVTYETARNRILDCGMAPSFGLLESGA